jgi:hypothetical protein
LESRGVVKGVIAGFLLVADYFQILMCVMTVVIHPFHEVRHILGRGLFLAVEALDKQQQQGRSTSLSNTVMADVVPIVSWIDALLAGKKKSVVSSPDLSGASKRPSSFA